MIIALLVLLPVSLLVQPYEGEKGDVNNDGSINVLDMLSIANHILGIVVLDEQELWRADLNGPEGNCDGDGSANILDMVKIANIIMGVDACGGGTVTDIDDHIYKTVTIGKQIWLAENLRVTRYRNGDPIPYVTDNNEWYNLTTGAYCHYDHDTSYVATYGRLYNWYAVADSRGIAPEGWHVPSDEEWKQLEMYLGMSRAEADRRGGMRGTNEGGKLKTTGTIEAGTGLWYSPNRDATNESGFSALPAGYRQYLGWFDALHYRARFWSSTESDSINAWDRWLDWSSGYVGRDGYSKNYGLSVRCVRDTTEW